jgi:hypothetical protein
MKIEQREKNCSTNEMVKSVSSEDFEPGEIEQDMISSRLNKIIK